MDKHNTTKQTSTVKDIIEGVLFGLLLMATIYVWSFVLP